MNLHDLSIGECSRITIINNINIRNIMGFQVNSVSTISFYVTMQ